MLVLDFTVLNCCLIKIEILCATICYCHVDLKFWNFILYINHLYITAHLRKVTIKSNSKIKTLIKYNYKPQQNCYRKTVENIDVKRKAAITLDHHFWQTPQACWHSHVLKTFQKTSSKVLRLGKSLLWHYYYFHWEYNRLIYNHRLSLYNVLYDHFICWKHISMTSISKTMLDRLTILRSYLCSKKNPYFMFT